MQKYYCDAKFEVTEKSSCNICGRHRVEKIEEGELKLTTEDTLYEGPARGDKSEAIRTRYCLENNQVYEGLDDDYTYYEKKDGQGEEYLCFKASELDSIHYKGNLYFIKRFK